MAEIEIKREGKKALVTLAMNIMSSTVPRVRSELKALITDDIKEIVIDLSKVSLVDSMGIGLFIAAHNSLHKVGGKIALINTSKDLLDLFKAMRLDQHFSISGS